MLLFSEPVRLVEFVVTNADGLSSPIMVTSAGLQTRYLIPVSGLERGTYTVSWRALKSDKQVRRGTVAFTVR
jgi:methionine-rich copper-binding protein CopC